MPEGTGRGRRAPAVPCPNWGTGWATRRSGGEKGAVAQQGNGPAPSVGTHRDAVTPWSCVRAGSRWKAGRGGGAKPCPGTVQRLATRSRVTPGRACRHAGRAERGPVRGSCRTRGEHPGPEAPAARSRALAQGMTSCPRSRPKACRSVPGSPGGVDVGGTPRVPLPRCQGPPAPGPGSGRSPGRRMLPIRWTRPRPRRGWGPARGHRPSAGAAPAPQAVPRPARSGRTP